MEPAQAIIKKFGGEAKVCEITGTALTGPYRWQYPRSKGGTDGLIPQRYHPILLDYARKNGIDLRAEDFLPIAFPTPPQEGEGDRASEREGTAA